METPQEDIVLTLNHQGEDVVVVVDLSTAERLLNDPTEAEKFVEELLSQHAKDEDQLPVADGAVATASSSNGSNTNNANHHERSSVSTIWKGKGRPTATDDEATTVLLKLREKYAAKFDDKKTIKTQLWCKIAEELAAAGYNCGSGKDAGERCRQKFANLQKLYLNYKNHVKRTGEEKKDPPPFFDEVHSILGAKDKVNPKHLQDTEEVSETDSGTDTSASTSADNIKNRFSSVENMKRNTASSLLLNEMKKQHTEDQEQRKAEFYILQKHLEKHNQHLETQNQQRQEMLNVFREMVQSKKRRRRSPSSDESADD